MVTLKEVREDHICYSYKLKRTKIFNMSFQNSCRDNLMPPSLKEVFILEYCQMEIIIKINNGVYLTNSINIAIRKLVYSMTVEWEIIFRHFYIFSLAQNDWHFFACCTVKKQPI